MSVTVHTDLGDIKVEVFCEQVPKAAENFLALCASEYYNGCLVHRNIPGTYLLFVVYYIMYTRLVSFLKGRSHIFN